MQKNHDYFMTVAKELNFRKAAEKLYISQPALSKYIGRLEANLGISLFDRSTSPLKLTYAGELYRQYLENTLQLDKQLSQKFKEIASNERGQIRIGLTSYRGSVLLPEALPVFQKKYPLIQVVLTEGNSSFLFNELFNEQIQFCISNPIDTLNYNLLDYDTIFREKIYLAVSTRFPRLNQYIDSAEEVFNKNNAQIYPFFDIRRIQHEQFFMTNTRQSMTYIVESALSKNKIHLNNVFRSSNLTTAINLVTTGLGFAFVPEFSLHQEFFPKNLLCFNFSEPPLFWEHAVFFKKDSYVSIHCKAFIDTLKQIYGNAAQ